MQPSHDRLFPRLTPDDFAREPDTLRLVSRHAAPGRWEADSFHRRGASLGMPARLHARIGEDPRQGRTLHVQRFDHACLDAGDETGLGPEGLCPRLQAHVLDGGAWQIEVRDALRDRVLDLVLSPDLALAGRWNLVSTGRRSEPDRLSLTLDREADESLGVRWQIEHTAGQAQFVHGIRAEIDRRDATAGGFSPLELALATGVELFLDILDLQQPWALQVGVVDTLEPEPGSDGGLLGCEDAGTSCSAEYDTCVPVPGGWLGCMLDPRDPPWQWVGGGDGPVIVVDDDDNKDPPPQPLPDWRAGSFLTQPKTSLPRFHGVHVHEGINGQPPTYGISMDITSVLQRADAQVLPFTQPPHPFSAHVTGYYLTRDVSGEFACGLIAVDLPDPGWVPVGDTHRHSLPGSRCDREPPIHCEFRRGIYVLRYHMDPTGMWDEGADGEANNFGSFMGTYYIYD